MKHFIYVLLPFLIFLFHCNKRVNFKKPIEVTQARLTDIVIPVDAYSIVSSNNSLHYLIKVSREEIVKYYQENLEIYGWQKVVEFDQENVILFYEKPHKYLSIVIVPIISKHILKVIVYVQEK